MAEPSTPPSGEDRQRGRRRSARKRSRRPGVVALVPLALLASSAVVYQASNAAFSAQTNNPANNWQAGTVALTDNDGNGAMFNVTGIKPAQTGTKCIIVTYSGTLPANVKLYVTSYSHSNVGAVPNGLGAHLSLSVEQGTYDNSPNAGSGDCAGFTSAGPTFLTSSDTVHSFAAAYTNWASGKSTGAAWAASTVKMYRFIWTMDDVGQNGLTQTDVDALQGSSVTATFTWEAQNT